MEPSVIFILGALLYDVHDGFSANVMYDGVKRMSIVGRAFTSHNKLR